MRILAIGDFHGRFPVKLRKEVAKADLVLCTGDLGGSDKLLKILFKYFGEKWWNIIGKKKAKQYVLEDYRNGKKIIGELGKLGKKIYVINGNWDFATSASWERTAGLNIVRYPKLMRKRKNLVPVNRSYKRLGGLNVLFFGGMVTTGAYLEKGVRKDVERGTYIERNRKEVSHIMKYVKKDVDILFAHYPPFGYFDKVKHKGENPMNGRHVGFKGYTKFIEKNQPALFVCGHMHEYQGKKKIGKTIVVTTGSAKNGEAAIIDFDIEKKRVKKVEFVR